MLPLRSSLYTGSLTLLLATGCQCGEPIDPGSDAGPTGDADTPPMDAPMMTFRDGGPLPDRGPGPGCGDGIRQSSEACDDGNTESGDGCSGDCSEVEEGWACPTPGEPCVRLFECGNGILEGDEECDDRNTGSGDGCDSMCRIEEGWTCPTPGLPCRAAECGDGIVAGDEECDDGNAEDDDGCDSTCRLEDGFACDEPGMPCRETTCGDGVPEGTEQCDDGNNDLGDGCDPFCRLEPVCTDGVCVAVCGDGIIQTGEACDDGNTRSGDGCSSTCEIEEGFECVDDAETEPDSVAITVVFRDFRGTDLEGGHPDFEYTTGNDRNMLETMLGADGKPVYAGSPTTPTTNGVEAFDQWYRDGPLAMTELDRLVLDRRPDGSYVFDENAFFPLNERGWVALGMEPLRTGGNHNFHFTSELRYWFEFNGGEELNFRGDDDVWVFINRRLVIDIGGVHGAQEASVTLDEARATELGLTTGGIYEVVVFQAERHTTQSSYRLTLRNFRASRSECDWICGDGIVTRFEICDDGVNDGSYGSCTPDCLGLGPHCGDGVVQEEEGEECDEGSLNVGGYEGCNADCTLGPRCGDGVLQPEFGEECDDGNTEPGDGCDESCRVELG